MSDLKAALTEAVTNALESRQLVQHAQIRAAVAEVAIDVLLALPGVAENKADVHATLLNLVDDIEAVAIDVDADARQARKLCDKEGNAFLRGERHGLMEARKMLVRAIEGETR